MITEHDIPAECAELFAEFRLVYHPLNAVAESIVRDIAVARWQILRLDSAIFGLWNVSPVDHAGILRFNRQIDQLDVRIARLERRLKFIHANFSTIINDQPVEETNDTEEPISLKEFCPETIAFYQRYYPKSKIIIMPPDAAAKGVNTEDRMNL